MKASSKPSNGGSAPGGREHCATDLTIVPMRPQDVPGCLRLLSAVFGPYADRARFDLIAAFNFAMGYPPSYLVAWSSEAIVGLVGTIELWRGSPRYDIPWLAVVPDHQGQGLGRRLVLACLAALPERAIVYVETDKPGFYARCGFSDRGPTEADERLMSLRVVHPFDPPARPSGPTPSEEPHA